MHMEPAVRVSLYFSTQGGFTHVLSLSC